MLIDEKLRFLHPYKTEVEQYKYPTSMYIKSDPTPYLPFESTTATFVDTLEAVAEMLEELKAAKEIAIDLEHHDTRSYVGIVSLMQISTRNRDWIVDTLKPWRRKLECLNEVFADPKILKVKRLVHEMFAG
jgi:exosome complex exonuclease RRP6